VAQRGPKEARSYDGHRSPGNIIDNVLANLDTGMYSDAYLLTRIRIVGFDGRPIALLEQNASGQWSRK
jgi:hypothetical protein